MLDLTMLDADLVEMIADLSVVVTWMQQRTGTTATWAATVSESVDRRQGEMSMIVQDRDVEVVARVAAVTIPVVCGDKLSVGGKVFRVESVQTSQDGLSYTMQCVREFR